MSGWDHGLVAVMSGRHETRQLTYRVYRLTLTLTLSQVTCGVYRCTSTNATVSKVRICDLTQPWSTAG